MTQAISNTTATCSIRSTFQYCTASLRSLVQKIKNAIVRIFQCVFPCIFGKAQPAPIRAAVVQATAPSPTAPPALRVAFDEGSGNVAPPPSDPAEVAQAGPQESSNDGDSDSDFPEEGPTISPKERNQTLDSEIPDLVFQEEEKEETQSQGAATPPRVSMAMKKGAAPKGLPAGMADVALLAVLKAVNIVWDNVISGNPVEASQLTQIMAQGSFTNLASFEQPSDAKCDDLIDGIADAETIATVKLGPDPRVTALENGTYEANLFLYIAEAFERIVTDASGPRGLLVFARDKDAIVKKVYGVFASFSNEKRACSFYLLNPHKEPAHPDATWKEYSDVKGLVRQFPRGKSYAAVAFTKKEEERA